MPITGLYAALGIMAGLVERGRTGQGSLLEISMLEAMMHFAVEPFTGFFALGDVPTALDRPRLAQAFIVRCGDGKLLGLHLSSIEKFWTNLVEALGDEALASDPRFIVRQGRIDDYPVLLEILNGIFAQRTRAQWLARLEQFDLPFAPVNSIAEAAEDPQAQHLDMVVPVSGRLEGALKAIRAPMTFDGARDEAVGAAPVLDQHSQAIRQALAERPGHWPARPQQASWVSPSGQDEVA